MPTLLVWPSSVTTTQIPVCLANTQGRNRDVNGRTDRGGGARHLRELRRHPGRVCRRRHRTGLVRPNSLVRVLHERHTFGIFDDDSDGLHLSDIKRAARAAITAYDATRPAVPDVVIPELPWWV